MKRTTVLLPDDLAYLLDRERRHRGVSTAQVVREAVAAHFKLSEQPRRLEFASLGRSGRANLGRDYERYLDEEWGAEAFRNRMMGRFPAVVDRDDSASTCRSNEPFADSATTTESAAGDSQTHEAGHGV